MNVISSAPARAIPDTGIVLHPAVNVAVFFGLLLGAAFCMAAYGLDLSAGFF
jgi:hypothetical protein